LAGWFTPHVEGDDLSYAMLVDLAAGRRTRRLESFLCADDVGARFIPAPCRAASARVECTWRRVAAGSIHGSNARLASSR
jgi:hypothetical protein